MNLLETYKNRLNVSESVYKKNHEGSSMDSSRKMMIAKVLQNTNNFLNEALTDSSMGTQRADMQMYKKFCLNLTTVALPNLIANDLVIVHPMSSMSGYITYIEYMAGKTKGETQNGDVFNSPFKLGKVNEEYTSNRVTEAFVAGQNLVWSPVVQGSFYQEGKYHGDVKVLHKVDDTTTKVYYGTFKDAEAVKAGNLTGMTFVDEDGQEQSIVLAEGDKIGYVYDNIIVPQNDLPTLRAEMKSIPLIAKARRIAVFYSQIAAFQAKTDYGFDLGDQLAEKAVGQLSYEIDTEVVKLLVDNAREDMELMWSKTLPVGVSKAEHYEGFSEIIEIARQKIYDATKRFAPNYMIIASNVLPILTFMKGFTAAPASQINGPYFCGTLNSLKVYVSPAMQPGEFVCGVNGDDMMSSAAVYAPYMAIVPTQLLQYADGGSAQGWSTMYDLRLLNKDLLVKGRVVA